MARLIVERGNEKGVSLNFEDFDCAYVVGRSGQCHLVLTDFLVSRQHFRVERSDDLFSISDMKSHNGTFVNGARIQEETMLLFGDTIRSGETLFSFLGDTEKNEGALAGQKIGGYHLLTRIGVGGMGEVYKATQMALGRQVALKILSPELTQDRAYVAKFVLEARAAGKLNHPHVVQVHEVNEENGVFFYSMEFIGGGSVQDLISGGKKMEAKRALLIINQAAQALEYAEKQKIVHCDVKPDNLMLSDDGDVRLADLGIAKFITSAGKADQTEGVFGSPHYMAPEQARGLPLDNRADLYSLGVTMYRMFSGKLPFTGNDAKEIMEKQVFEECEPLRKLEPNLPPMVYQIAARLMKKKPQDRYQTSRALITDLEKAQEQAKQGIVASGSHGTSGQGGSGSRLGRVRRRGSKWFGFIVLGVVLLVGGLVVSNLVGRPDRLAEAKELVQQAQEAEKVSDLPEAIELYGKALRFAGNGNLAQECKQALEACKKRLEDRKVADDAQRRFEALAKVVEENRDSPRINLDHVRAYIGEHENVAQAAQWVQRARDLAAKCEDQWQDEARKAGEAVAVGVKDALGRKDYDGAQAAVDRFPGQYQGAGGAERLDEARKAIQSALETDIRQARDDSNAALGKKEFERAVDVFMPFIERARQVMEGRYRLEAEQLVTRVRKQIQDLKAKEGDDTEKKEMQEAEAREKSGKEHLKGLRPQVARGEFDLAKKTYQKHKRKAEEIALESAYLDLKWLESLQREIVKRSEAGNPPLEKVSLPGGDVFPVMAIDAEGIRAREADDKVRVIRLETVSPEQVQKMLRTCSLKGEQRIGAVVLWLYRGLPTHADNELREAKREQPRLSDDRDVQGLAERVRRAMGGN